MAPLYYCMYNNTMYVFFSVYNCIQYSVHTIVFTVRGITKIISNILYYQLFPFMSYNKIEKIKIAELNGISLLKLPKKYVSPQYDAFYNDSEIQTGHRSRNIRQE